MKIMGGDLNKANHSTVIGTTGNKPAVCGKFKFFFFVTRVKYENVQK